MRDIHDFNHIDPALSKEKVETLKVLYAHYRKKHLDMKNRSAVTAGKTLFCNLSAGKLIITAALAGGIMLNPAVIATLIGVGLTLKAVASLKKYDKKTDQANLARIEYKKILDERRYYLRGEPFDEKTLLDRLKLIHDFITDRCMEIPVLISEKYNKIFAPL